MSRHDLTLLTDFYELTMMQATMKKDRTRPLSSTYSSARTPTTGAIHLRGPGPGHRVRQEPELHLRGCGLPARAWPVQRGVPPLSERLPLHRGHLRHPGGHGHLPEGTPREGHRTHHGGAARGNCDPEHHQPPEPHRHKGVPRRVAAGGDGIMEFGLRRAQGPDAGLYGARAAIIGGCIGHLQRAGGPAL